MERHAVSRLIGAPPGYVGYEEGGQLSEAVRRRPYSVVLFDEIEKAHPEVFNVLLQVLDDGRLTDGQGRTVDFRNTVIIMTSNLGSSYIVAADSTGEAEMRTQVMDALHANFRPEFLNRIDEVIIFKALTKEQIAEIVEYQLHAVSQRLSERNISLTITPAARDMIATLGYDPVFGARPLKRVVQRHLLDPLALKLLSGEIHEGEEVVVDVNAEGFTFRGRLTAAPVVA
jgi:ATP-dependent Clp protease ATP-binding subunit ClpB